MASIGERTGPRLISSDRPKAPDVPPLEALASLRAQIEELAGLAAAGAVRRDPIRIEPGPSDADPHERHIWHQGPLMTVLTCNGGVFVSAHSHYEYPRETGRGAMEYWPNWTAVTATEAREVANALLSAAAHVTRRDHLAVTAESGAADGEH